MSTPDVCLPDGTLIDFKTTGRRALARGRHVHQALADFYASPRRRQLRVAPDCPEARPGVTRANLRELQRMIRCDDCDDALRVVRPGDPNQDGYEAVAVPVLFMPTVHMTTGDGETE